MAPVNAPVAMQPAPTDRLPAITEALARITLPATVLDLDGWRVVASNQAWDDLLAALLKVRTPVANLSLTDYFALVLTPPDREMAAAHLREVASGDLIGYEVPRHYVRSDGQEVPVRSWVRRLDCGNHRNLALVISIPDEYQMGAQGATAQFIAESSELALLVTDHAWRVEHASSDVGEILGVDAAAALGTAVLGLVHPGDAPGFLMAVTQVTHTRRSAIIHARLRAPDDSWRETLCYLTALCQHDPPRLGIMVRKREPDAEGLVPSRVADLEQYLWQIGLNVRAAGFLPEMPRSLATEFPREFAELSSRQWEIVGRLVRGERVPDIARAMFLSPSTVRNHLTAVFRKFGVHSQAGLLAKLRKVSFPGQGDLPSER